MKRIILLVLLIVLSVVVPANQLFAFPFYDPFTDRTASGGSSYAVGSKLATQNDGSGNVWNAVGTSFPGAEPMIVAGNLTYTNLPPSTGNSVSFVGANSMGDRLNFNASIGTTNTRAYYSYLLKITDITAVPTTATTNFFAGFSDGFNGQTAQVLRTGARVVVKKSGAGFVLGMSRNSAASDYVYDTTVYNVNDVIFIVASYDRLGGVTNVNLWINPPPTTFGSNAPPSPTVTVPTVSSFSGDINASSLVQGFMILCQNATAPGGIIDDVRIGTNWSIVTGGDPAIITAPTNRTVPAGNSAVFSIVARGTPTLTYQWYKDGTTPLSNGGNISGATTATLTVNNVSAGDVGSYSVFVTNGVGDFAQSAAATLSLLTDPIINSQPQNITTNFGGTATFQVGASGTGTLSYRWHKQGFGDLNDGGNISGSHSNTLTLSSVAFPDGGDYWVTVSNSLGVVDSSTATLTVFDPYISSPPVSVTTNAGATVSFQVGATGTGPFTYQWLKNGNLIFDGGNLSGTSSDTLSIANVGSTDQAAYSAAVIGAYSSVTSSVAILTVLSPASIAIPPRARAVAPGTKAAFSVGAGGSGPFTYQWQKGSVDISGANSSTYVVTNVQAGVEGDYRVVVSNSFSSVTSSIAPLTISNTLTLAESNLVIIRVGDGAQTLTTNGNPMFLDQFTTDGTYVNTITFPEDGASAMTAIGWDNINGVQSGSTTGSGLSRSLDRRFMVVAGYNTNLSYNSSLATSFATNVPRGIALIDSFGQYTLAVSSTNSAFDQTFWRSAVTDGTNNFWGSGGITGTYYFGFDGPPAVVQSDFANIRSMALFNGDIYCAGAVSGKNGVLKINGMPQTATAPTVLFAGSSGTFDMVVSPNGNLIYVTDQRAIASGGGVQRYDFDGSTWALTYTLTSGFGNVGPRYVTADFSGANPVVYVTSNDQTFDNDRIVKLVDTGASSTGTTLAYAGANQTFRGIRFGPIQNTVAPRPVLSFVRDGNKLILTWAGAHTLQSSTNVTGTFLDVSGATSPYTNNMIDPGRFFRLHN